MIVVAERRSGGTKFCIDLANEKGLTFVGESSDRNIEELKYLRLYNDSMNGQHPKSIVHETKFQEYFEFEDFVEKIESHDEYVWLHNDFVTPVGFDRADIFLMRESPRDTCISVVNFVIGTSMQNVEFTKDQVFNHAITLIRDTVCQSYMITRYCLLKNIEPVFYERLDWSKPVNSTFIDQLYYSDQIYDMIDNNINETDLDFYRQMLLTLYP